MGEAKRRRMVEQTFEAVRETLWTTISDAAGRREVERGDLLALPLERGMLLDGFTAEGSDCVIAGSNTSSLPGSNKSTASIEPHLGAHSKPAPEPRQGARDVEVAGGQDNEWRIDPGRKAALGEATRYWRR